MEHEFFILDGWGNKQFLNLQKHVKKTLGAKCAPAVTKIETGFCFEDAYRLSYQNW